MGTFVRQSDWLQKQIKKKKSNKKHRRRNYNTNEIENQNKRKNRSILKTKETNPKNGDSDPGAESHRVVDTNPLQLWGAGNGLVLPGEAGERGSQGYSWLSIVKLNLVNRLSGAGGANSDLRKIKDKSTKRSKNN